MDITLLTEAAYECMSPDQMNAFEALFADADLARRYANCVRKRLPAAPQAALTDEQIMNIADSYLFTWDEGIVAFACALLATAPTERMSDAEDAARYRWLKGRDFWLPNGVPYEEGIDAARKAELERGNKKEK